MQAAWKVMWAEAKKNPRMIIKLIERGYELMDFDTKESRGKFLALEPPLPPENLSGGKEKCSQALATNLIQGESNDTEMQVGLGADGVAGRSCGLRRGDHFAPAHSGESNPHQAASADYDPAADGDRKAYGYATADGSA
jgi:hypothetical protein